MPSDTPAQEMWLSALISVCVVLVGDGHRDGHRDGQTHQETLTIHTPAVETNAQRDIQLHLSMASVLQSNTARKVAVSIKSFVVISAAPDRWVSTQENF